MVFTVDIENGYKRRVNIDFTRSVYSLYFVCCSYLMQETKIEVAFHVNIVLGRFIENIMRFTQNLIL